MYEKLITKFWPCNKPNPYTITPAMCVYIFFFLHSYTIPMNISSFIHIKNGIRCVSKCVVINIMSYYTSVCAYLYFHLYPSFQMYFERNIPKNIRSRYSKILKQLRIINFWTYCNNAKIKGNENNCSFFPLFFAHSHSFSCFVYYVWSSEAMFDKANFCIRNHLREKKWR